MSNEKKTLADARSGGRVRLGDAQEHAKNLDLLRTGYHVDYKPRTEALDAAIAALSAQPSPGGQGDALTELTAKWRRESKERFGKNEFSVVAESLDVCAHELEAALAARQPVGEPVGQVRTRVDGGFIAELLPGVADRVSNLAPLYVAPAQAVDLGQFRAKVAELLRGEFDLEVSDPEDHRHDDGSGEADRIAGKIVALLDSQAVGNG